MCFPFKELVSMHVLSRGDAKDSFYRFVSCAIRRLRTAVKGALLSAGCTSSPRSKCPIADCSLLGHSLVKPESA